MFVPQIDDAISEIVRVLRPGGRLVASELDHETIFHDSHFPEVSRKVFATFAANQPQPRLGRQLHRLMAKHGLRNVKPVPRVLRTPYNTWRRIFEGFLASAVVSGQLMDKEIGSWLTDCAELAERALFNFGVVVFTVTGEKP